MAPRVLSVGMMGDDVAGLHQNLSQQGFKIPASETARRFYGPVTLEAVRTVQKQNQVPATGHVDTVTAKILAATSGAAGRELVAPRPSAPAAHAPMPSKAASLDASAAIQASQSAAIQERRPTNGPLVASRFLPGSAALQRALLLEAPDERAVMLSLQRTFKYAGDPSATGLSSVSLVVQVGAFTYGAGSDGKISRTLGSGICAASATQALGADTYRVALNGECLTAGDRSTLPLALRHYQLALGDGDLDALTVPALVTYQLGDGQVLGQSTVEMLIVAKGMAPSHKELLAERAATATDRPAWWAANKAHYIALRTALAGSSVAANDSLLLAALSMVVSLDGDEPAFSSAAAGTVAEWMNRRTGRADGATILSKVGAAFSDLVDFPLTVPAMVPLVIKGTFRLAAPAGTTVGVKDFKAFELSAEFGTERADAPRVLSCRFDDSVTVTDGAAPFDLTCGTSIVRNAVQTPVTVRVRGLDGSVLWTPAYQPSDPALAALDITIPIQAPTTLTVAPTGTVTDQNLKLRGRVVTFEKACVIKDVMVLIQTKTAVEAPWRVVGAATTDGSGNFSVRYPYGTYTQAQAVVSLAPQAPVAIAIVATEGRETLSQDFLYLWVTNPECPPPPDDEDCDCSNPSKPNRLPDYSDLIGSDAYSQDIGGSCVNLTKPNRTINEFRFKAIVRISDPYVASYTLSRVEAGLDDIDPAMVPALASGAHTLIGALDATQSSTALLLASLQTVVQPGLDAAAPHAAAVVAAGAAAITPAVVQQALIDAKAVLGIVQRFRQTVKGSELVTALPAGNTVLRAVLELLAILQQANDVVSNGQEKKVAGIGDPFTKAVAERSAQNKHAEGALDAFKPSLASGADALKSAIDAAQSAVALLVASLQTVVQPGLDATSQHRTAVAFLSASGTGINLSALAAAESYVQTVITIVQTLRRAVKEDGLITDLPGGDTIVKAAGDLKDLIRRAIDTVGTAVRYELAGGTATLQRQPVALDNPIRWQDAPEPGSVQRPLIATIGTGARLKNIAFERPGALGGFYLPLRSAGTSPPVGNEATTNFSQAVSVATGHILHYKVLFKADGYSLGDLLYSLPLAPGQKKEIVVFDATHSLMGGESQSLTQNERLAMGLVDERNITSQLAGRLSETLRGSSQADTKGISAGFGTGGQGYGGGQGGYGGSGSAVIGVAGGVAQATAEASQDSSRQVAEFFDEKLRQSITQNAEGYRQLNASVVTTVQEGQHYGVTTDVVANHNHCHALTMMYFEVLRHYAIYQDLAEVEECLFVPLLLTRFTTDNIAKWRDVLAPALLPMPSETYLQPFVAVPGQGREHPLIKAFDADQRIRMHYANIDFPDGAYDEEPIQFIKGSIRLRVNLPRPRTRFDRILSFPIAKHIDLAAAAQGAAKYAQDMATYSAKAAVTGGFFTLFQGPPNPPNPEQFEVVSKEAIFDNYMSLDANFENVPPSQCIRVLDFSPKTIAANGFSLVPTFVHAVEFFTDNIDDRHQWEVYAKILGYQRAEDLLNAYFKGNLISEWDTIFQTDILPLVFDALVNAIRIDQFAIDLTSADKYHGGERLMDLNILGTTTKTRAQLPLLLAMRVNNATIRDLAKHVTVELDSASINYSTRHLTSSLYSGPVGDDLLDPDGARLTIPENDNDRRIPRREDRFLSAKLIEHLNTNLEYYNRALWLNLDPDRRYMLLDGFSIQVRDMKGDLIPVDKGGMRSLASVVKNEVITVAGNSLVLPVAPGYRVSGAFVQPVDEDDDDAGEDGVKKLVTLLDHYRPVTPMDPYRVSVPSRGVFAEAVQGACNACEKIEIDRLQDWNRFPNTDEPTPIGSVTVPTPTVTDYRPSYKDFAAPIVNVQNAPAVPAPGAGLAGLADLLGKSGVFKDVTGLDATQQNALKTYLSNNENAKAFGEMAKELAMQQHNTQNSSKITEQIDSAKQSGKLTQQEAGQLTKEHIQQQIDGGATKKAELEKTMQQALPSVAQAGVNALNRGRGDITTTITRPDGFVESVDAKYSALADQATQPAGPVDSETATNPSSAGQVTQPTEDDHLIAEIARNVVALAGWGTDPDRDALEGSVVAALHAALEAQGTGGTYNPVAGAQITPVGLARGIRAVLNLSDSAPVGWRQVSAVLQELFQDQDPFSGFKLLDKVKQMPQDLQPSWDATDPEEADPGVISLAAQTIQDVVYGSDDMGAAAFPAPAATGTVASIAISNLIKATMRRNKKFFSTILQPQTQKWGNEVERIIQADYILQHPGHRVLIDFDVWDTAMQAWRVLDNHGLEDLVRQSLVSLAGDRYKPDICDLDSREVFEIKPLRKVFTGLAQLYLHYLIPLNVCLFGFATAKAVLESMDYPFTGNLSLPEQPFLPGKDFKSPRWYPLSKGSWVFVMLAAPGVIGYQVISDVGDDAVEKESLEDRKRLLELMAAMIAAAVAALGARNVSGRPFTPDDLPPLAAASGPGVTTSTDLVFWIMFLGIAALAGLVLAPEVTLPILTRIPLPALATAL